MAKALVRAGAALMFLMTPRYSCPLYFFTCTLPPRCILAGAVTVVQCLFNISVFFCCILREDQDIWVIREPGLCQGPCLSDLPQKPHVITRTHFLFLLSWGHGPFQNDHIPEGGNEDAEMVGLEEALEEFAGRGLSIYQVTHVTCRIDPANRLFLELHQHRPSVQILGKVEVRDPIGTYNHFIWSE